MPKETFLIFRRTANAIVAKRNLYEMTFIKSIPCRMAGMANNGINPNDAEDIIP